MEVVGEANNGTEAVRQVAELRPSILLVNLSMPDLTGVEVTGRCGWPLPMRG
jgi:YesN/AraC family two-component response regulator